MQAPCSRSGKVYTPRWAGPLAAGRLLCAGRICRACACDPTQPQVVKPCQSGRVHMPGTAGPQSAASLSNSQLGQTRGFRCSARPLAEALAPKQDPASSACILHRQNMRAHIRRPQPVGRVLRAAAARAAGARVRRLHAAHVEHRPCGGHAVPGAAARALLIPVLIPWE